MPLQELHPKVSCIIRKIFEFFIGSSQVPGEEKWRISVRKRNCFVHPSAGNNVVVSLLLTPNEHCYLYREVFWKQ